LKMLVAREIALSRRIDTDHDAAIRTRRAGAAL
jgi:hypothetical protein